MDAMQRILRKQHDDGKGKDPKTAASYNSQKNILIPSTNSFVQVPRSEAISPNEVGNGPKKNTSINLQLHRHPAQKPMKNSPYISQS